jgi:hypothetical protein
MARLWHISCWEHHIDNIVLLKRIKSAINNRKKLPTDTSTPISVDYCSWAVYCTWTSVSKKSYFFWRCSSRISNTDLIPWLLASYYFEVSTGSSPSEMRVGHWSIKIRGDQELAKFIWGHVRNYSLCWLVGAHLFFLTKFSHMLNFEGT